MNLNLNMNVKEKRDAGFTLLELLIVISIIAILSVALVLVLNPAEALRKSRDAQRISDLSTMKTALGLYLTSTSTPLLGGTGNATCKTNPATAWGAGTFKIYYSLPIASDITDANLDGATSALTSQQAAVDPALTDGTGWIPVPFDNLTGGSPISNLPLDPVNAQASGGTLDTITSNDLFYRYACSVSPLAFEMDAVLESEAYTIGSDNKKTADGGNSAFYYEIGTNLKILGTGATPF